MRILHLPEPVAGYAWSLATGERSLGLESEVLYRAPHPFGYPADRILTYGESSNRLIKFARLARDFMGIRSQYDVFHFNYGASLFHFPHLGMNQAELPFYPKKAKLFVTYNGCDARQKFPTMQRTQVAACQNEKCYGGACNSGKLDEQRRAGIVRMAKYAHHMWALNPDLMHFLPENKASFLPYPIIPREIEVVTDLERVKLRVVHAPTNREAKGSIYILEALKRLSQERPNEIEVILVEGMSHADALKVYASADLIIDQILIGWYGGFAVETMFMGKPVIARIAREDLKFIPPEMARDLEEAVINADPSTIYSALRMCLENREFLKRRAQAAKEYANRWHRTDRVAQMTRERYESV